MGGLAAGYVTHKSDDAQQNARHNYLDEHEIPFLVHNSGVGDVCLAPILRNDVTHVCLASQRK